MAELQIDHLPLDTLTPYARNSRTHSDQQIAQIAASIREFGFTNPVLVDGDGGIIAGHGRVMAAQELGMDSVPCIVLDHLTETQKRAYVIADNKLALNAGWDYDMLTVEFDELEKQGFSLELTGFSLAEIEDFWLDPDNEEPGTSYSTKIDTPIYTPSPEPPQIFELFDNTKTKQLQDEIKAAGLPDEIEWFLKLAAERHTVLDFHKIADYYAHASPKIQGLMEKSALVIIDFNKAIEYGYVELTQKIKDQYGQDHPSESEGEDDDE